MGEVLFTKAVRDDADETEALYKSVIGTEFCTWNELYPSREEIDGDLEAETLFVLKDGKLITGAISVVPQNELDELTLWKCNRAREIARVAVLPERQGKSLATYMVGEIEKALRQEGVETIHLLVAKKNIPARKLYAKLNYEARGEVFLYENEYFAMEKIIGGRKDDV